MGRKRLLRAGGTAGGREAGTILALPDDVMVQIFQHVEDGNLLVVIPSVRVPGSLVPIKAHLYSSGRGGIARSMCPLPPDWSCVAGRASVE